LNRRDGSPAEIHGRRIAVISLPWQLSAKKEPAVTMRAVRARRGGEGERGSASGGPKTDTGTAGLDWLSFAIALHEVKQFESLIVLLDHVVQLIVRKTEPRDFPDVVERVRTPGD